ncbi:MAG: thymidylate synthase [Lachnospirales bacterium]
MSLYDDKYLDIVNCILKNGYFDENRTKTKTYKLPHQIMQFDLEKEFPILTTKKIAFKTAIKELLWIFRDQSNNVKKLHKENVHIWDEWEMEDGTIGTSYGYIVNKYKQVDELIYNLKNEPQSRRMIINLWQNQYLETGALYPCCFMTMWDVTDGRLNCMLVQRSGDMGLGVPFNTTQYAVLVHLIAQVAGLKVGLFTHVINNAHIYENHVEPLKMQSKNERYEAPKLEINKDIKNFYDFTINDVNLIDYKYNNKISMEVSV